MSFSSTNTDNLTRANLWSQELKDIQLADCMAKNYVRMIDFPDGDTLNIPSIGQFEVSDYAENMATRYTAMDTGNYTFTITEYKQVGTYITRKAKQDLFYAEQLVSSFVPKMSRAIEEDTEAYIFGLAPGSQTASNTNAINGAPHRWIGSGPNETMDVKDFALADNALQMANAPMQNKIAIVHPSVEYKLKTLTNLVNASNNPTWTGVVSQASRSGYRFSMSVYGWDIYVSQFLTTGLTDTISAWGQGSRTAGAGVANLFLTGVGQGDSSPFLFAVRQPVIVDTEFNKDFQRDEYVVTTRYGGKVYRPENFCVVITDTDQVGA